MHSFDTETLWQMIYAARDSEKYWRRVRRDVKDGFNLIYTYDEADGLFVAGALQISHWQTLRVTGGTKATRLMFSTAKPKRCGSMTVG